MSFPLSGFLNVNPRSCAGFKESDLRYWLQPDIFQAFISGTPDVNSLRRLIQIRSGQFKFRAKLTEALKLQYEPLNPEPGISKIIESLNDANTFVITCAHQPVVLGGPLYWWYKILHTITLCQYLKREMPEYNFVPVYFMGNEDHDFAEISELSVFGKKLVWNRDPEGAVGRMSVENLDALLDELLMLFTNDSNARDKILQWRQMAALASDYSEFFLRFVHDIFGSMGLVCLNPDNRLFKSEFRAIMLSEITDKQSNRIVSDTNQRLSALGLDPQAHSREINLLYHSRGARSRIVESSLDLYVTHDEKKSWSLKELQSEITDHPENFSPNVILRPLYQELILPSILFVGGGAEVNYWMQLKNLFEHFGIPYPVLVRRNSFVIYPFQIQEKIRRLGLLPETFLKITDDIIRDFINEKSDVPAQVSKITSEIYGQLEEICELARTELKSTYTGTLSEVNKIRLSIEKLSEKIGKDNKNEHQIEIGLIRKLKDQLFPNNNLQERQVSGLTYYLMYGNEFLHEIQSVSENQITGFYLLLENS